MCGEMETEHALRSSEQRFRSSDLIRSSSRYGQAIAQVYDVCRMCAVDRVAQVATERHSLSAASAVRSVYYGFSLPWSAACRGSRWWRARRGIQPSHDGERDKIGRA